MRKKLWIAVAAVIIAAGVTGYLAYEQATAGALGEAGHVVRDDIYISLAEAGKLTDGIERIRERAEADPYDGLGQYETLPIEVTPGRYGEKTAYLTFDDGPGEYTEELLDILDQYEVKATFFVVGSALDENGQRILKDIADRGHTIGIHCYDHDYSQVYASTEAYVRDFEEVFELIAEVTGVRPNVWRFPGGSTIGAGQYVVPEAARILAERGFSFYDWNVSTGDGGNNSTSESVIKNAKKTYPLYDDPVILMHDVKQSTVNAVPELIELLQADGYGFDTVDHRNPISFIEIPGVTDRKETMNEEETGL